MQSHLPTETTAPLYGVRYATAADCEALAPELCVPDLAGIEAVSGNSPYRALAYGLKHSDPCLTIFNQDNLPVGMFGAIPALADIAGIWFLASEELEDSQDVESFARHIVPWIDALNTIYPALFCVADARNTRRLDWLRFCQFDHVGTFPAFGIEGRPFEHFQRHRHV